MSTLNDDDRANLSAYLDGELDEQTAHALEAKLHHDADARAEFEALKRTMGLLDYLPKVEPSPTFTNRTLERLSLQTLQTLHASSRSTKIPVRPPRAWLRWAGWAAAVLVALIAGAAAGHFLTRPAPASAVEDPLIENLRLAERFALYQELDDFEFLEQLADLFEEEAGS